jgi:hypothetical protein
MQNNYLCTKYNAMETIFRLHDSELTPKFIETLKSLFKNQEIEITVRTSPSDTEYLLIGDANKKHLIEAIEDAKADKNLIRFTANEFETLNSKLLAK